MPSPKRMRTEISDNPATPNGSETVDDFDDIYNTPPHIAHDTQSQNGRAPEGPAEQLPSMADQTISLPGLGNLQESGIPPDDTMQMDVNCKGSPLPHVLRQSDYMKEASSPQTGAKSVSHSAVNAKDEAVLRKICEGTRQSEGDDFSPIAAQDEDEETSQEEAYDPAAGYNAKPKHRPKAISGASEMKEKGATNSQVHGVNGTTTAPTKSLEMIDHDMTEVPVSTASGEDRGELTKNVTRDQDDLSFHNIASSNKDNPEAEFELDSSPLSSSSSDTSTDSSSDDGDDDSTNGEGYDLLSPEEQARRLMAEDGESEDDNQGKNKSSRQVRTQNEKPDEEVPKPSVTITEDMKIEVLGTVDIMVENTVLVKARTSGEYQVLEAGSVLCLENRTVIGAIAETLGRVQQPYYSVRFSNDTAIKEAGLDKGTVVYFVEQHSSTVFTQPLKGVKGSDASNLHDEEVGADELEFSDDEAEAEHKRRLKMQKQARRTGRESQLDGFSKGPRGVIGSGGHHSTNDAGRNFSFPQEQHLSPPQTSLNYDEQGDMEADNEDLYTPLTRPSNFHEMMIQGNAPVEARLSNLHGMSREDMPAERIRRGNSDRGPRNRQHRNDRGGSRGHGRGRAGRRGGFSTRPMHEKRHSPSYHQSPASIPSPLDVTGLPAPPHVNGSFGYSPPLHHQNQHQHLFQGQHQPSIQGQQQLAHPTHPQYPQGFAQYQQHSPPPHPPHFSSGAVDLYGQQFSNYGHQPALQQAYAGYSPTGQPNPTPPSHPPSTSTQAQAQAHIPAGAHVNPAFFRQQHMQEDQRTQTQGYPQQSWYAGS